MSHAPIDYSLEDRVALLRFDDGKANALSHAAIEGLHAALDRAEKEAGAVCLVGREGRFCAGFDLAVMRSGPEPMRRLVAAGAEILLRMAVHPLPIAIGCTGHALAAGALLLLAADARIGARGEFKIGLNEVAIGMPLPIFAYELARERLSKRHLLRAATQAELYAPEAAVDAGFLDSVCEPAALAGAAQGEARRLAALPQPAFGRTKAALRGALVARIRATQAEDVARLSGPEASADAPPPNPRRRVV
jgi:enoyl-CoA hydratase